MPVVHLKKAVAFATLLLAGGLAAAGPRSQPASPQPVTAEGFLVAVSGEGLSSLKRVGDLYDTDYVRGGRSLGNVVIHYRRPGGKWKQARTDNLDDIRRLSPSSASSGAAPLYQAVYDLTADGRPAFRLIIRFRLGGRALHWEMSVENLGPEALEVGDLCFPLPFNTGYGEDSREIMERRVIKHHFIAGGGSFLYWLRPNGVGPFLLMTPAIGTSLEYFEFTDQVRDVEPEFYAYIHSAVKGGLETRGTWRQPHTSLRLSPRGQAGDSKSYAFTFRWVSDFEALRQALFEQGLFDIRVVPGMTVPEDLSALIAVRTKSRPTSVAAEFPSATRVEDLGERSRDTRVYRVTFSRLGENLLRLRDAAGRETQLEFFVTEPLEILIKKRAAFLVSHQQHRRPDK